MLFADQYRGWMAECADAITEVFGELVTVHPTSAKPNFQPTVEPGRSFQCPAVFTWVSETAFTNPNAKRTSGNRDIDLAFPISTRKPLFSFALADLPTPINHGFLIERCVDGTKWSVTEARSDGISRLECKISQLGKQTQCAIATL